MPIRERNGFSMPRSRHSALSCASRCCIATAMRTQARASSATPLVSGSPKKPRIASPMNLSMVAPYCSAIADISVRYSLSSAVRSSGCIRSVVPVKFSMSEKKIVSFLRSVLIATSLAPLKMLL